MSVTIDYFFNSGQSLSEIQSEINRWIGCDLRPHLTEPGLYCCRLFELQFLLGEHDLENDGDIDFESFRYELGLKSWLSQARYRPMQMYTIATIAEILYNRLGATGILVYDLQIVLARYAEEADAGGNRYLVDLISGDKVEFPGHFANLTARAPSIDGFTVELAAIEYLKGRGEEVSVLDH